MQQRYDDSGTASKHRALCYSCLRVRDVSTHCLSFSLLSHFGSRLQLSDSGQPLSITTSTALYEQCINCCFQEMTPYVPLLQSLGNPAPGVSSLRSLQSARGFNIPEQLLRGLTELSGDPPSSIFRKCRGTEGADLPNSICSRFFLVFLGADQTRNQVPLPALGLCHSWLSSRKWARAL